MVAQAFTILAVHNHLGNNDKMVLDEDYSTKLKLDCETKASESHGDEGERRGRDGGDRGGEGDPRDRREKVLQVPSEARLVSDDDMTSRRRERLVTQLKG